MVSDRVPVNATCMVINHRASIEYPGCCMDRRGPSPMPQCKHRANRHMMGTKVFIEIAIFMEGRKRWRTVAVRFEEDRVAAIVE